MPTCEPLLRATSSWSTAGVLRRHQETGTEGIRIVVCRCLALCSAGKWKGRTVLVEVLAEGFRYESRSYPSLSAIAVAVTGTRWNGLAFFGLTRAAGGIRKEQPNAEK